MNEIGDDFYATIKLKSGEEIFSKVAPCEEDDRTLLILSNPIIVEELTVRGKFQGFKMEPWIKTSNDDMFILNMNEVMTMSESNSIEMILYYQEYVRKINKTNYSKLDRKMGYLSSVHEAKEVLEKLFNNS
jgi:hypothetical protein|tara:strand:- start:8092 stop:8484 length:393 start_codon:yes stop_codon:yes gene_type:complete